LPGKNTLAYLFGATLPKEKKFFEMIEVFPTILFSLKSKLSKKRKLFERNTNPLQNKIGKFAGPKG
jgi:hypothetical protein